MNAISFDAVKTIRADIAGLSVFASLREEPLMRAFRALLDASAVETAEADVHAIIGAWSDFMAAFLAWHSLAGQDLATRERAADSSTWRSAVAFFVIHADNEYTRIAERKNADPSPLLKILANIDLERLSRIASFDVSGFGFTIAKAARKAGFEAAASDIESCARALWEEEAAAEAAVEKIAWSGARLFARVRAKGAGILGQYAAFRWNGSAAFNASGSRALHVQPVRNPDPVTLSDLFGYEDQRNVVIANTTRFLEGKAANNLLLYGDRGTGKSATVKAVCNEYAERGLRLVEVHKEIARLQTIMQELSTRGLRFVVFIDDLSFETTDDSFTGLKALLEGGVEKKPENIVVYATSNRRHFVKEHSIQADAPRAFDAVQEQLSLADRFGLTVVFTAPDQEEFLSIAEQIAERRGLFDTDCQASPSPTALREKFHENAVRWERWFNGRSPRAAAQFVDWVSSGEGFPWE
ncbi:MAG: ATP-binding protein [Treponema sp.]|jgi:predicted AAA+ superfamily ATPase|nr:ATP-binding protein [Treponema sp.]